MNILNENEAIVINSLENWSKVAEILDKHNIQWKNHKASEYAPVRHRIFTVFIEHGFLVYSTEAPYFGKGNIQDTEFIAKHSKNIFQEQMEAFYSQPLKQDKNMKIKVLKENGLLEVGQTLKYTVFSETEKTIRLFDGNGDYATVFEWQFNKWLENGYIEEAKEVSYKFEDISGFVVTTEPICSAGVHTSNQKQLDQIVAFAKLTHVRAKILKDHGYSENWETGEYGGWIIEYVPIKQFICIQIYDKTRLALTFPTRELAELALQHNQELFKQYLGV